MKLHKFLLAVVAAAAFAVPTSQLSADIVFANLDTFDSGVRPGGDEDRTNLPGIGIPGATAEFTDSNGLTYNVTTIDIFGADGTSFLAGTGTTNFHETNVAGGGAFGVNTDTDQDLSLIHI